MKTYRITLLDPQTHETTTLAEMPERRTDPRRPKGRPQVINWIKATYGEQWYLRHQHFIGIIGHNGRKANP